MDHKSQRFCSLEQSDCLSRWTNNAKCRGQQVSAAVRSQSPGGGAGHEVWTVPRSVARIPYAPILSAGTRQNLTGKIAVETPNTVHVLPSVAPQDIAGTSPGARRSASRHDSQVPCQAAGYCPCCIKSATCSPIIMVVAFVLARMQSGMMEASAMRSPSSPCTRPYWSTTAIWSEAGPILQVPDT